MSSIQGTIGRVVLVDSMDRIFAGNGAAISRATGAKNKKLDAVRFKRRLTSTISTLKVPVKDFRRTGRKLSHINAGTYS